MLLEHIDLLGEEVRWWWENNIVFNLTYISEHDGICVQIQVRISSISNMNEARRILELIQIHPHDRRNSRNNISVPP